MSRWMSMWLTPARAVALVVVASLMAFGCGVQPTDPGTAVTLRLAGFPNHGLDGLIAEWEAEHPGVEVEVVERQFDLHHEWLFDRLASRAGGDDVEIADIAMVEIKESSIARANPEWFVDLRSFGAEAVAGDYLDWRWANGVADDGSVIGIPTDVGGLAVAYRVDLFERAGLPTDREALADLWPDWDGFLEVGRRYVEATGQPFMDDATSLFEVALYQDGGELFYDESAELIAFDSPSVDRAWELALTAIDARIDARIQSFQTDWTAALSRVPTDESFAVVLAPAWMRTTIKNLSPASYGSWDLAPIPAADLGGNWGGSQLSVVEGTEHGAEAWDLVRFLLSPSSQQRLFVENGNFPSTPEIYDDPALADLVDPFFNNAPVGQIFTEAAQNLRPYRSGPHDRLIMLAFRDGLHLVADDDVDVAVAWARATGTIDALVD